MSMPEIIDMKRGGTVWFQVRRYSGMALPYLLVAFVLACGGFLPKLGPRMNRFKQAMAYGFWGGKQVSALRFWFFLPQWLTPFNVLAALDRI